jgi:hypothetical protein
MELDSRLYNNNNNDNENSNKNNTMAPYIRTMKQMFPFVHAGSYYQYFFQLTSPKLLYIKQSIIVIFEK